MMMGSGRPAGAPFDRLKRSNPTRSPSALPHGPKTAASHAQWVGNPSAARGTSIQSCKQEPRGGPAWVEAAEEGERAMGGRCRPGLLRPVAVVLGWDGMVGV